MENAGQTMGSTLKPKKREDKPTLYSFWIKTLVIHHQEMEGLLLLFFFSPGMGMDACQLLGIVRVCTCVLAWPRTGA